jgi:hypothetical protein
MDTRLHDDCEFLFLYFTNHARQPFVPMGNDKLDFKDFADMLETWCICNPSKKCFVFLDICYGGCVIENLPHWPPNLAILSSTTCTGESSVTEPVIIRKDSVSLSSWATRRFIRVVHNNLDAFRSLTLESLFCHFHADSCGYYGDYLLPNAMKGVKVSDFM